MKGFEARMQTLIFRFMALSPLTLPAGFPLNLSIGVLADRRAVIKFAFKLTGFLSALLRGLISFRCRWWLGWQVWVSPQFGFALGKLVRVSGRCSPSV